MRAEEKERERLTSRIRQDTFDVQDIISHTTIFDCSTATTPTSAHPTHTGSRTRVQGEPHSIGAQYFIELNISNTSLDCDVQILDYTQ